MITDNPKFIKFLIIVIFGIAIPITIIGIDMFEKNVTNPRIWEGWTCDEMEKFALENRDDALNDFQTSKFHEDLSECLSEGL